MIRKILALCLLAIAVSVQARTIDPMTQAVLNAYEDILKSDPSDYTTLYQRALQYYQLEMYTEARQDVEHALRITPDTDKELKAKEYELLGSICAMKENYGEAVDALRHALALQPGDYELNYRLGEFCLLAGDNEGARAAFTAMQRKQSRSPEAMLGLARVDIAQGKLEDAMAKMKYAEEFNSSLWTTQHSIGNLLVKLGQPQQATMAYIRAIALADGQSMPLESLFELARTNYPAVKAGIDEAIAKSPNSAAMPLLLGNVAFETGHYRDASVALNNVLGHNQGRQPGVYSLLAECLTAQGRAAEAIDYAGRAVELSPKANFLTVKARAQRATGKLEDALATAQSAVAMQPSVDAYTEQAEALMGLHRLDEAKKALEAAEKLDPADIHTLVLEGLVADRLADNSSRQLYARAANAEASTPALTALKGLAQIRSGKTLDGDATLRNLLKNPTADGCYWAAVAYANAGEGDRAVTLAKQARELGFENLYLLDTAFGPLTLRP